MRYIVLKIGGAPAAKENKSHHQLSASRQEDLNDYHPEQAYIVNLDLNKTSRINKTTLVFMPVYELLRQTVVL